ncbi:hypothetical protein SAMN05661107_3404 [Maritimibacter sp. HL-12]|nr:hypothetical protein SAMN05661107_3404 [Maritimibacter sp. HL-12]
MRALNNRGLRPDRGGALAPALGAGRAQTGSQAIRWGYDTNDSLRKGRSHD